MAIDFNSEEDNEPSDGLPYQVKLEQVFEGPMDLLIHLIKKNEVDIYDIPIALITDQFLAYINFIKSLNIDLAGDFIVMAATLTQLKSKMLLPLHDADIDESEDPRMEIARPLLEYLQMKSVAESLGERNLLGEHIFTRPFCGDAALPIDNEQEIIQVGLFELIDAFQKIIEKAPEGHRIDLSEERISIKDKIAQIIDILEEKSTLTLEELFTAPPGKREIIITFLAVLEMVKLSLITIAQHVQSGIIRLFYQ
ncbi:MAG: segregation/condensation protein A [Desulfobacterales bacterium]|jgi:segregation and condensation protein A|nr:segregation/condensation protein A [Desulfobacterales bacterium]